MKRILILGIGLTLMFTLAACGGSAKSPSPAAESETPSHYPLTIQNFKKAEGGTTWEKKDQVFDKAPERIMANTRPSAELLLHLGLADKIVGVGASFGQPDKAVEAEYAKLNILSDGYVGKEVTMGTNPDLVMGRGGLFDNADWGVGTVDTLNEMGIRTYVLESSVAGGTYESIYNDIKNLGEIFEVQDKAKEFAQELKSRQEAVISKLSGITENKTYVYLHMSDPKEVSVLTLEGETFFNGAMNMIKLDNALKDQTGEGNIEMLIEADPDVLIIPDWTISNGTSPDKIKDGLYANPKLSGMKAIINKQIYAMDYNYMFGYGYNTLDGIEILAKEMYPDLFK